MLRQVALFALWTAIGFALSLELVLYLFTPSGLAIGVPLFALIWWLEGRGLGRQPGGWGALVGPGLFCLLVAANADSGAQGWAIAGGTAIGLAVTGFMVAGRRRCA
jgi:hypothetical protein